MQLITIDNVEGQWSSGLELSDFLRRPAVASDICAAYDVDLIQWLLVDRDLVPSLGRNQFVLTSGPECRSTSWLFDAAVELWGPVQASLFFNSYSAAERFLAREDWLRRHGSSFQEMVLCRWGKDATGAPLGVRGARRAIRKSERRSIRATPCLAGRKGRGMLAARRVGRRRLVRPTRRCLHRRASSEGADIDASCNLYVKNAFRRSDAIRARAAH